MTCGEISHKSDRDKAVQRGQGGAQGSETQAGEGPEEVLVEPVRQGSSACLLGSPVLGSQFMLRVLAEALALGH